MPNNNRFLIKILGLTMQSSNLKSDNFIKFFWHVVLMMIVLRLVWVFTGLIG